ncbi:MAG: methyltransferase [Candidatus Diapherotrites archaeon]|nr:methyltransferase [Candidatus Diapherotrites archaeon]
MEPAKKSKNSSILTDFYKITSVSEAISWKRMKKTVLNEIKTALKEKTQAAIADFGCGWGNDIFMINNALRKPAIKYFGFEKEAERTNAANKFAKIRGIKNCTFVPTNVFKHNFKGEFDLVLSSEVIEHLDGKKFLEKTNQALKKGGTLILTTPNDRYLPKRIFYKLGFGRAKEKMAAQIREERLPQDWTDLQHTDLLNAKKLEQMLENAGFLVEKKLRGTITYGGAWLDNNKPLFLFLQFLDWILPKTWISCSWDMVFVAKKN